MEQVVAKRERAVRHTAKPESAVAVSNAHVLDDYDDNGEVNAVDYAVWRMSLGQHVANNSGADGNGNDVINAAEHVAWAARFGNHSGQSTFNSSSDSLAVPEPARGAMLAVLIAGA